MKKLLPLLMLLCSTWGYGGVIVGDKEWRQITDTTGLSWNQVATACSTITGACSGSLGTASPVDFTGWTWASAKDLWSLFNYFIPGTVNDLGFGLTPDYSKTELSVGNQFFSVFMPTLSDSNYRNIWGITRDSSDRFFY